MNYRAQFRKSLAKARKTLTKEDNVFQRCFGLRPKHLYTGRVESVTPQVEIIGGTEVVTSFCFEVVRHPSGALLKQCWNVSTEGSLQLLYEHPVDRAAGLSYCKKFVPYSELRA
jgi:hypothetical protein